ERSHEATRRLARAQAVPRSVDGGPGDGAALRAAVGARDRGARLHRPWELEQGDRAGAEDLGPDGQEPHHLDPAQARREQPYPSSRLRAATRLDQDAGALSWTPPRPTRPSPSSSRP